MSESSSSSHSTPITPSELRFRELNESQIGRVAVDFDDFVAEQSTVYDYYNDSVVAHDAKTLGSMLKIERGKLLSLYGDRRLEFQEIFNAHATPYIRHLVEKACEDLKAKTDLQGAHPATDLTLILGKQHENRRYAMPNKSFLNVLQWHSHYVDERDGTTKSSGETSTVLEYKEEYEARYKQLITDGVLPELAFHNLMMVYETPITQDRRTDGSRYGYYSTMHGVVLNSKTVNSPHEKDTAFHELTHASSEWSIDAEGGIRAIGAFEALEKYPETSRIFREGITEMITAALMGDEYSAVHARVYPDERNIITALCETSEGAVTSRDFVEAYFDNGKVAKLVEKLKEKFGDGIISHIDKTKQPKAEDAELNSLQQLSIKLYLAWAKRADVSKQDALIAADRMIDIGDHTTSAPQFLRTAQ